jgi:hypothetical protein
MLEDQLPPHDSDPKYCRSLNDDEKNELRIFNEQQRHSALGRAAARQLPLTQSPLPCRGVSCRICHSSFMLLRRKINTHTSYETRTN